MESNLPINILPQPDDITCGPTCLHAVYDYYGDKIPLENLINEVPALKEGGTLLVNLACHALRRGFKATIYTYKLQLFDPTWFVPTVNIKEKLIQQMHYKTDEKFHFASNAYIEYLDLGGKLKFEDLNPRLLQRYLNRQIPVLTGLSATYLYNHAREYGMNCDHDDILGEPSGHFVVLSGYNPKNDLVCVADPLMDNPYSRDQKYFVKTDKLICSILLGIITYDANLLIIEP